MSRFSSSGSFLEFRNFITEVYGRHNDRLNSLPDLMSNTVRYTMRALKGIRKDDKAVLTRNLVIAFSWIIAVANRLHVSVEGRLWERFPNKCSYCGQRPCACKAMKVKKRVAQTSPRGLRRPKTIKEFQRMFQEIYPAEKRTIEDAGIHLAEEAGEVSEVVHAYLGKHRDKELEAIREEIADYISCVFGVANSANIDLATELSKMYHKNCYQCHNKPCTCRYFASIR